MSDTLEKKIDSLVSSLEKVQEILNAPSISQSPICTPDAKLRSTFAKATEGIILTMSVSRSLIIAKGSVTEDLKDLQVIYTERVPAVLATLRRDSELAMAIGSSVKNFLTLISSEKDPKVSEMTTEERQKAHAFLVSGDMINLCLNTYHVCFPNTSKEAKFIRDLLLRTPVGTFQKPNMRTPASSAASGRPSDSASGQPASNETDETDRQSAETAKSTVPTSMNLDTHMPDAPGDK
jgi:hypothetical protein